MTPSRQPQEELCADITWSPDSSTINEVLTFCERALGRLRARQQAEPSRHAEARMAILERIYGNLHNVNSLTYPSSIKFSTVVGDLTRNLSDTPAGKAMAATYIRSLESEWDTLQNFFDKTFTKHDPDY